MHPMRCVENELLAFVACHGVTDSSLHSMSSAATATTPEVVTAKGNDQTVDIEEDGGTYEIRKSA
jgi:hypothetical protein